MKKHFCSMSMALIFVFVLSLAAWAVGPSEVVIFPGTSDPCQNPAIQKQTKSVAITNATGELVPASSGKTVYVCDFEGVAGGVTPKIQLRTGTKTANPCDTGTANLTGLMNPTSGIFIGLKSSSTLTESATSGELCGMVNGSSSAAFTGVMTYVQQ